LPAAGQLLAIPRQRLDGAAASLPRALKANTHAHHRRYGLASAKLTLRVLDAQVAHARQRLTANGERMAISARALMRHRRERFAGLEIRLKASRLANVQAQRDRIARADERTQRLAERARRALSILLQRQQARIAHSGQLLAAFSYRGVLARGFALVRDDAGQTVRTASAVGPGALLSLEFADGRVAATASADRPAATSSGPASPPKPTSAKRPVKPVDQGNLF
jgi:exodeoxyribonuclease VII large subunit